MSADGANAPASASTLNDLPQFELAYELDDPVEPSEVTVYAPDAGDETTHWITAGVADAVDLTDVA